MSQYITSTLIENKDDYQPVFEFDAVVIKPDMLLRIGSLSIHLTPERMKSLGEFILSQIAREDAARDAQQADDDGLDALYEEALAITRDNVEADTALPPEITRGPETPFDDSDDWMLPNELMKD